MVSRTDQVERMLIEDDLSILYLTTSLESTRDWLIEKGLVLMDPLCFSCQSFPMNHGKDATNSNYAVPTRNVMLLRLSDGAPSFKTLNFH